ncbi:hypothetical protein SCHPADRAFT_820968 [Schizopora paradoxa]|uniref:Amidohydrolase 3 domain-containing protein n=1 Tax=Schizopora paradoxa TaxID=27342 RepID=A0A0H2S160_9AGAM|nr:hypothetical protein SCHPADRAFT_820968 [Schizopora paradoxa]
MSSDAVSIKGGKGTAESSTTHGRLNQTASQNGQHGFPPRTLLFIFLVGISLALIFSNRSRGLPADYALCSREGRVYTVDESNPQTECIVVHGNKIIDWGKISPVSSVLPGAKNGLKIIYTDEGHIVIPGLADAHAHIMEQGLKRQLELDGTDSKEAVLERVKAYVLSTPDVLNDSSIWIRGWGWDQTKWNSPEFPTADDFDSIPILRGRPISLKRIDGHSIWVSQTIIDEAGALPDYVEGGEIIRDKNGDATGIFVDNAQALIVHPEWTDKQLLQYFASAVKEIVSYGLTSIHDAWSTPQMIRFYKKMADENKLPIRLYLMGNVESYEYWGDQIEQFVDYGTAARLTLRSVKLFVDGALGSWGAALQEPYSDKPESRGLLLAAPEVLSNLVRRFWDDGFQVNIHCIGDLANNVVLDIFEDMQNNHGLSLKERRPRIEHAQIINPTDIERFGQLNVIPSVQPTHATSDMWYAETRLGPGRIKNAYVYRSLLESSVHHVLPLGSDFPVEGVNPLLGFYAATSRLSVEGESPHGPNGWFPDEKLTRQQALKGMTLDPAYASFNEDRLGSLTPGKLADYVVLDTDIMTVEFPDILKTKVIATVIDGRPVYGKLQ